MESDHTPLVLSSMPTKGSRAIRWDWLILLATGIVSIGAWAYLALSYESLDIEAAPRTLRDFALWTAIAVNSWSWTTFRLFIGMPYLDFSNNWLQYAQEAVLPFFLLHQPVIIAIALYVVQWEVGIPMTLVTVVLGSLGGGLEPLRDDMAAAPHLCHLRR